MCMFAIEFDHIRIVRIVLLVGRSIKLRSHTVTSASSSTSAASYASVAYKMFYAVIAPVNHCICM